MTDAEKEAYGHNVAAVIPVDSMNPANQAIPTHSSSSSNTTSISSAPVTVEVPEKRPIAQPSEYSEDPELSEEAPFFFRGQWVWFRNGTSSKNGSPGYISSFHQQSHLSNKTRYKYGAQFYFKNEDDSWKRVYHVNISASKMVPAEENDVRKLMGTS
jgi:hypothetical protein